MICSGEGALTQALSSPHPWAGPPTRCGTWQLWPEAGELAHLLGTNTPMGAKAEQIQAWGGARECPLPVVLTHRLLAPRT